MKHEKGALNFEKENLFGPICSVILWKIIYFDLGPTAPKAHKIMWILYFKNESSSTYFLMIYAFMVLGSLSFFFPAMLDIPKTCLENIIGRETSGLNSLECLSLAHQSEWMSISNFTFGIHRIIVLFLDWKEYLVHLPHTLVFFFFFRFL